MRRLGPGDLTVKLMTGKVGRKPDRTAQEARIWPPKPEKGPQGGELLTMQAVGLPGTGLSMDKSWGIRGK